MLYPSCVPIYQNVSSVMAVMCANLPKRVISDGGLGLLRFETRNKYSSLSLSLSLYKGSI